MACNLCKLYTFKSKYYVIWCNQAELIVLYFHETLNDYIYINTVNQSWRIATNISKQLAPMTQHPCYLGSERFTLELILSKPTDWKSVIGVHYIPVWRAFSVLVSTKANPVCIIQVFSTMQIICVSGYSWEICFRSVLVI